MGSGVTRQNNSTSSYRRYECDFITIRQHGVGGNVLAIDGDGRSLRHRIGAGTRPYSVDQIADLRPFGQVELELLSTHQVAVGSEKKRSNAH